MSIHLERKDLMNVQQMEVAVNGPDGATHLVLCTGVADLSASEHEIYTFSVGPQLSRRQFVGVIASGALSTIEAHDNPSVQDNPAAEMRANLISIDADYDDRSGCVEVRAEVFCGVRITKVAMSYNVNILAELPGC